MFIMDLRLLDDVLIQQVLITGQVQDGLNSRPTLAPPRIALVYQNPPGRPYALELRQTAEGQYAFFGNPRTAFPILTGGSTLGLQLVVSAEHYQTQTVNFSLTAGDLTPTTVVRQIAGRNVEVSVLTNLPVVHDIALLPQSIHLAGRVVEAADPTIPLENAQVRVIAPAARGPVSTNDQGFFTLHDLPIASEITVRVTRTGFQPLEEAVRLDYGQAVNQRSFALET